MIPFPLFGVNPVIKCEKNNYKKSQFLQKQDTEETQILTIVCSSIESKTMQMTDKKGLE